MDEKVHGNGWARNRNGVGWPRGVLFAVVVLAGGSGSGIIASKGFQGQYLERFIKTERSAEESAQWIGEWPEEGELELDRNQTERIAALERAAAEQKRLMRLVIQQLALGKRATGEDLILMLEAMLHRKPETIDFQDRDRLKLEAKLQELQNRRPLRIE